jgi:hypothetical protein
MNKQTQQQQTNNNKEELNQRLPIKCFQNLLLQPLAPFTSLLLASFQDTNVVLFLYDE